jgi:hypothetical protein
VSKKHRDQQKRREADMRMAGFGMPESDTADPEIAERNRLLTWAWPLVERPEDAVLGDDDGLWHLRLSGEFTSAPVWQREQWDLCYGKGRNCLAASGGHTTCVEVEVGKRLAGWNGGWWNNYSKDAPARWAQHEVLQGEFRHLVSGTPLEPLFRPQKGIADVIVWRDADAGLEVVAVECKCLKPKDPISDEQDEWMSAFAATVGRDRCAFAEWVRTES